MLDLIIETIEHNEGLLHRNPPRLYRIYLLEMVSFRHLVLHNFRKRRGSVPLE
jgi:hypothetical protein